MAVFTASGKLNYCYQFSSVKFEMCKYSNLDFKNIWFLPKYVAAPRLHFVYKSQKLANLFLKVKNLFTLIRDVKSLMKLHIATIFTNNF